MNAIVHRVLVSAFYLLLALNVATPAQAEKSPPVLLQALVGASSYDSESLTFRASFTGGETEDDLSNLPTVGLAVQFPLAGARTEVGVEGSALFGWQSDNTTIISNLNQTFIRVEARFWTFDLAAGLYLGQLLGERWRWYFGGGPVLLFAEYSEDRNGEPTPLSGTDAVDNSTNEFGFGAYARTGIEFRVDPTGFIGIGVRGLTTNLEFDPDVTGAPVRGVQGFLSFSRLF